jgi:signal transduction histidine kinase/ActR/RegA family two-component response regulator
LFSAADAEQMRANDLHVLETDEPQRFVESVTVDGDERRLLAVKFPIMQGGRRLVAGVSLDITEQMRAEAQLREDDQRKNDFLATLAHELRNPLSPMRTAVAILGEGGSAGAEFQRAREVIERQLRHMTRLLDDLMDVSRITRNRLELRRQPVALAQVIAAAVETSQPLIDESGQHLQVQLPDAPLALHGDLTRLSQVFSNLLNNAAKYSDRGSLIALHAQREGDAVAVTVEDSGIGIDPAHMPHLFEMFFQAGHVLGRTQGGLGIGLSLVRGLVEAHGGRVHAYSAGLGKGSRFVVHLPLAHAHVQYERSNQASATDARGQPRVLRILVVDDNRDAAESLAMLLRLKGHGVDTAADGGSAVTLALHGSYDVIVLDIGLPDLPGYEVARRIRAQPDSAATLVALTGWGQERDRQRAAEAGFDRHMTKPVDLEVLERILQEVASRGAAR